MPIPTENVISITARGRQELVEQVAKAAWVAGYRQGMKDTIDGMVVVGAPATFVEIFRKAQEAYEVPAPPVMVVPGNPPPEGLS